MTSQNCTKEKLCFDISKIVEVISGISIKKEIESIEKEIVRILKNDSFNNNEDDFCRYLMNERINILLEKKKEYRFYRILKNEQIRKVLRNLWMNRNANMCRSNTSSVSDPMINTIPTPPTAAAVKFSCGQRGITNAEAE